MGRMQTMVPLWPMAKHLPKILALGERDADVPLLNIEKRFGVFWSPKSACSTVMIWYYHTIGRLEEARAFDRWPHKWRIKVLYKTPEWMEARRVFGELDGDWTILRVIRDPYARAISIFREVLQYGLERERLREFLGRDPESGYTFLEFLDFVAGAEMLRLILIPATAEGPRNALARTG